MMQWMFVQEFAVPSQEERESPGTVFEVKQTINLQLPFDSRRLAGCTGGKTQVLTNSFQRVVNCLDFLLVFSKK